jgi:SOS-response transcriptional repressor LexA
LNTIQMSRQRQMAILSSLNKLDFLTRSQIQRLHNLGSDRNACRVLANMKEYLNSFRLDENVFYLNKKGRELVGSTKKLSRSAQIKHILMRNEFYIYYGCPGVWYIEKEIVINGKTYVKPDVIFKTDRFYFLEVDHTQSMINNKRKINKYVELKQTGAFQQQYGYFPLLLWLTTSKLRKEKLEKHCEEVRLETFVVTIDELK